MNRISERLRDLREASGLSYQEIAAKSGVSLSTVRRLMLGQLDLRSLQNLIDVLAAMGCKLSDLEEGTEEPPVTEKAEPAAPVIGITEKEFEERLKPYVQQIEDLKRSRTKLFRCCCFLVVFLMAVLVFDLLNPGIGFFRP